MGVFGSMVLGGAGSAGVFAAGVGGVGAWSLCVVAVAGNSCWDQLAILGLVLLVTYLIYTKFTSNNRAFFHLW